jgi:hypothetical protein
MRYKRRLTPKAFGAAATKDRTFARASTDINYKQGISYVKEMEI